MPAAATYLNLENYIHQVGSDNEVHVSQNAMADAINNKGSGGTAHRELAKKSKYRGLLGSKVDIMDYFVPFVVEATGRMGPAAREFTGAVLKESKIKGAKQNFVIKLGAVIARYNAMMALSWAKKFSPRQVF